MLVTFAGHLTASRRTVGFGIGVIFVATLLLLVLGFGAYQREG